jgi:hypothetical protein
MWISDQWFLSRRDRVIVAWQFTARNGAREDPSRRVRCDGTTAGSRLAEALTRPNEKSLSNIARSNRSYRSLRDGSFSCSIPGSKVPGYDHLVPSGQIAFPRPIRKIDSTSGQNLEDQEEDDDEYSLPDIASRPVRRSFMEPKRQGEVGSLNDEAKSGGRFMRSAQDP